MQVYHALALGRNYIPGERFGTAFETSAGFPACKNAETVFTLERSNHWGF